MTCAIATRSFKATRRIPPFSLLLLLFIAIPASGQVQPGTPPFGSFGGGPEVINLGNDNAHWTIPVFHKPGRGLDFSYDLGYDTSVWYPVGVSGSQSWQPVGNWGWSGGAQGAGGGLTYNTTDYTCQFCNQYTCWYPVGQVQLTNWIFHDVWGAGHAFSGTAAINTSGCPSQYGGPNSSGFTSTAADGSGLTLTVTGSSNSGTLTSVVTRADGTVANLPNSYSSGTTTFGTDRNGNQITTDGSGHFYDTLSSTTPVLTVAGQGTPASPTTFTYTVPSGSTAVYTIKYTTYTIQTKFGCSGITEYGANGTTTANLVSEIDLPDGSKYTFGFETTPGDNHTPHFVTGRLSSVALPTGGTVSYTYAGGSNGIVCADGSTSGLTRQTPDGTWKYVRTLGSGASSATRMTDPLNNDTIIQFQGIYETQRDNYNGAGPTFTSVPITETTLQTSSLLQEIRTCYNGSASPCTSTAVTLPITQRAVNTLLDFGTLQGYGVSFWNSNGTPTEVDSYGYGSGAVGPLLKKTLYNYSSLGSITAFRQTVKVTDANGNAISQTNYNYDQTTPTATSGIAQHTTVSGSRGNLTSVQYCTVLPSCSSYLQTTLAYDDTGQVLSATDIAGNTTNFSYADNFYADNGANPPQTYSPSARTNAYVTKITAPIIGTASTFGYYFYTGQTAVSIDQNGADSYSHFDSVGRPSTSYLPPRPDGNRGWTLAQYPSETETDSYTSITSTSPSTSCTGCRHQQANLDSSGRLSTDVLVNDPDGLTTVAYSYDSTGRASTSTNPYRSLNDPTYGTTTPTYDAVGRPTKVTKQDGSLSYEYYGTAVASAGGAATQLCSSSTYGLGYPVLIVDPSGKKRQRWTDGLGRLFEVDEADQNSNLTVATCSSFDLLNDPTQVVQGTQTRNYAYDSLSRPTSLTTPEAGTVNFYYTTSSSGLCSGNPNLVCRRIDARGITTTNSYDALNRQTSASYSDSTPQIQFSYDQTSYNGLTITNGKGRLTGTSDASGTSAYTYDLLGQVLTENHTISSITKNISYTYNLDGSVASIAYPSGRIVSYSYSNAQRPLSALDSVSGNYFAKAAAYAPQGARASILYGYTSSFGGVTESYSYSSRLQLKNQTASSSAGTALNLNYGFPGSPGNNGRLSSIVNNVDNGRTANVTYDTLNRVSSAQSQATSGADCWGQSYGYDRWANLLSISLTQCSGGTLSVSTTNNHITNTGFSYDSAGNMTGDGTYSYSYDAEGHLTSAAGVAYTYDARDLRVKKSNGTIYWRSFLGDAFSESDLSGNIQNEYIFFGHERAARVDSGGNVYYYFNDRLGSVRAITNSSGTTCYSGDFTPFGTELTFTNTCPQNYKFTGFERDQESGMDYAIYRHYSSRLGRFVQPDPWAGRIANPQSLNRYAYVLNDPLNWADHLGLSPCPAGYHQANAADMKAAAQQYLTGNISYGHDNTMTDMDCSQLLARVATAVAGYNVPVITAGNIYNENGGASAYYAEGSQNGEVGEIVAFGGAYHVGIVAGTSPFTYYASNGSVSQNKTQSPTYGPGTPAGRTAFNDDPTARRFFVLCIKDKANSPAAPATAAASGGTSGTAGSLSDTFDWVTLLLNSSAGTVTTVEGIGTATASDGSTGIILPSNFGPDPNNPIEQTSSPIPDQLILPDGGGGGDGGSIDDGGCLSDDDD